jgi:hydrogenase nickel incorporation protein HypA/HybF
VRLGALSHFSPEHFREHWADATRGTIAQGSEAAATPDADTGSAAAQGVVLESVEVR